MRNLRYSGAILSMHPNAHFVIIDEDLSQLTWLSEDIPKPTNAEIEAKLQQNIAEEPLRLLRMERDKKLAECDWRANPDYTKDDKPQWATYREELRNLPQRIASGELKASLNEFEELVFNNWPTPPNGG